MRNTSSLRLAVAAAVVVLASCSGRGEPRPIAYDATNCTYCHMAIADRRFGAQLVSTKGKVHSFDSIECLATYVLQHREDARAAWVTDFTRPGTLLRADTARFVRGGPSRSPMALGLAAFGGTAAAAEAGSHGGEALSWTEVLSLVERSGGVDHATAHGTAGAENASR
jgi:copper chaperone NosL